MQECTRMRFVAPSIARVAATGKMLPLSLLHDQKKTSLQDPKRWTETGVPIYFV